MAKSYLSSGGDIPTVLKTLFHSPEFWAASDYRAKVKTPLEFVVSAARASNANIDNFQPLVNALRQMGMPLYGAIPPTGYNWEAADLGEHRRAGRPHELRAVAGGNRLPGITVDWAPELDMSSLDSDAAPTTGDSHAGVGRGAARAAAGCRRRERHHAGGGASAISGADRAESRRRPAPGVAAARKHESRARSRRVRTRRSIAGRIAARLAGVSAALAESVAAERKRLEQGGDTQCR